MCHACLSMDCMSHACLSMLVIVFVWIACVMVVFAIMHCPSMSACVVLTSLATLLADAIGCAVYRGPQWGQHLGEKSHVCHIVGFANQPYVAYTHAASKCGCYILLPPIMPTFLAFAASSQSLRPPPLRHCTCPQCHHGEGQTWHGRQLRPVGVCRGRHGWGGG